MHKWVQMFREKRWSSIISLSLLIIGIVSIGLLPDWLQYGFFYVGGDFADQQIPFILETKRVLSSGLPFWSWNTYFGQSFIASYSFYTLTSPFVWLNCLFPYSLIPVSITLTLYLKFICAGVFTYGYLREMQVSERMAITGGLLYAFSSFAIFNLNYYHFFEPLICFPLLLWAVEVFIKGKKNAFLILIGISFITAFINWYFIPCSFIATALYAACRIYGKNGIRIPAKRLLSGLFAIAIGVLMSSVILFPSVFFLEGSSRSIPSFPVEFNQYEILIWLQQVRSLFVPKIEEVGNSSPWVFNTFSSSAANLPVLGVLLPILYVLRKKDWLAILIIITTIIFVTPFNGIFSLFTNPGYSRWAYALSLFFVLATVKYLDDGEAVGKKELIIYVFVSVLVFLFFRFPVYWMRMKGIDTATVGSRTVDFLILSVFILELLFLIIYQRKPLWGRIMVLISVFSCVHLGVRIYERTDSFYEIERGQHYKVFETYVNSDFPVSEEAMKYRTDFLTRGGDVVYANMGLLKNIPGVSTYNSVKDKRAERLISMIDSSMAGHNSFVPSLNRASFDALMSVKNIVQIVDQYASQEMLDGIKWFREEGGYIEYEFENYVPLGFTYNSYITEEDLKERFLIDSFSDVPKQLLANLVVDENNEPAVKGLLSKGDMVSDNSPLDSIVNERRKIVCSSFEGNAMGFEASIDLPQEDIVFFSVLADPGFTAYVDGEKTTVIKANYGLSAIRVPEGRHCIVFRYRPPGLLAGLIVSSIAFLVFIFSFFIRRKEKNGAYQHHHSCL